MMLRALPLLLLALLLPACGKQTDEGPVDVSVIDGAPRVVDAKRAAVSPGGAALMASVAQGLVAFDGAGQIEPGVAIRWDVSDDGLYYTFRLDEARGFTAEQVARRLRAARARNSDNALEPLLGAIAEIVAVTPQVVEIRLNSPRPNLLQLLAQPELAVLNAKGQGTGPLTIVRRDGEALLLGRTDESDAEKGGEAHLRGERAARGVARYASGKSSLVLGGTFADLAVARAARLPRQQLRFDPAPGMFGLDIVAVTAFLGNPQNRAALAMAIDRGKVTAAFEGSGSGPMETLTPSAVEGLSAPALADWTAASLEDRRARARAIVAEWTAVNGIPVVKVALPPGPGARLLLALLQADWGAIGVVAAPARTAGEAELRLFDAVAPADTAAWYLRRFTCDRSVICSGAADAALAQAGSATTLAERSTAFAEAERLLVEAMPFIPIATPMRWSLVAPRIDGFQPNARAVHPLHHLKARDD